MKKWGKILAVIFGAVVVTALGIDAADTLSGSQGTMLAQLVSSREGECPKGMVSVPTATSFGCVDKFEVTTSASCPNADPQNEFATRDNINTNACQAVSEPDQPPWRFVSREQAQLLCSRSGKRLPSAGEWYQFAIGTPDDSESCNVNSGSVEKNGSRADCQSSFGVVNAVGNVWEWVSDDVIDGQFNGRSLPAQGFVTQVDTHGVGTVTNTKEPNTEYGADYMWSEASGAYGMMRGGFFGSKSDAGVFSVHANTAPTMRGTAIGFRCVL